MYLFLITFLMLYGGMHAYAFFRVSRAFSLQFPLTVLLISWLLFMTIAPLLVRLFEGAGLDKPAQWVAWPAYVWMGFLFIFCTALASADALRCAVWLISRFFTSTHPGYVTASGTCITALALTVLVSIYALYEARKIRSEHLTVTTAKRPPSSPPIRIVQISDVHLGLLFGESRLESILQTVRAAAPDILVSTGDLVDGRLSRENIDSRMGRMADILQAVPARIGKFAVNGNHEYYAGVEQSLDFTRKAGFTVLSNQSITLPAGISISGIDDPAGMRQGISKGMTSETVLLQSGPAQNFRLLLKHRPIISATSDGLFDLQLSGHVHNGQIFPFNLLVRLKFPIPCGTTATQRNSLIHVSRGSGTWGPPMRLLAPPEVTIIDIVSDHR